MYVFKSVFFIFSRHIPRDAITESYSSSIFRTLCTICTMATTIYTPTNCAQVYAFLHALANICYFHAFYDI